MLIYQYSCDDCENDRKNNDKTLNIDEAKNGYHQNGDFVFFIEAKMSDAPKSPKCPRCGGTNTRRNYLDNTYHCWVRGDGLVKDKSGARRDMNKYTLQKNDPYGYMRQAGEVDDLITRLENAGKDMASVRRRSKVRKKKDDFKKLSDGKHALLLKISEYELGCPYEELNEFDDVNKLLTDLMPDYVCKTNNGFRLMAFGVNYIEKCKELSIK